MDLDDTPDQAAWRTEVRQWLARHQSDAPPARGDFEDPAYVEVRRSWQRSLTEAGLVGVTWPEEHGGRGRGPVDQVIINQEMARAGVPGHLDVIGIGLMGPCIIAHGSDEQRARYLAPMLHGDEVWCQLFSEPAAGSDLAGVQTRAVEQADGSWRLTGQKVWTTSAQFAAFGMCLARTDPDAVKHQGLTMFIVPMDAPGITVRGLRQISGEAEFNEVFLDDVTVTDDMVVGGVRGGWKAALTVLMFERMMIGAGAETIGFRPDRVATALAAAGADDPRVCHRLGELTAELLAVRYGGFRSLTALSRGQIPGPEAGLAKITTVNALIAAADLVCDTLGPGALTDEEWGYMTSFLPGLKSAGGTEQILRTTIGERVLGLPAEPRVDKGVPFRELRTRQIAEVAA
ncbi:acyl-CoA dehydrogenase family protein [Conexibacter sp. DBS9H8]|uniref:acyl-CoA dehydrogenase family protein n=1 Tax=Conexibacter sp. DBS9H8 TaxID=2937801 RepID=UPI00200BCA00|nr:acyl-CoA dehydrogenase family protein [Conexibacter sp. DBS9H8]